MAENPYMAVGETENPYMAVGTSLIPKRRIESHPVISDVLKPDKTDKMGASDIARAVGTIGGGLVSWIPEGLIKAGGSALELMGVPDALKTAEEQSTQMQNYWMPKLTPAAERIVAPVAAPFQYISDKSKQAADWTYEKTGSPAVATAVRVAGEAIPFVAPVVIGKSIKGLKSLEKAVSAKQLETSLEYTPSIRPPGKVIMAVEQVAPREELPNPYMEVEPTVGNVFTRMPDNVLQQQAEYGVLGAKTESVRRTRMKNIPAESIQPDKPLGADLVGTAGKVPPVTPKPGTINIPAKENPVAEAGRGQVAPEIVKSSEIFNQTTPETSLDVPLPIQSAATVGEMGEAKIGGSLPQLDKMQPPSKPTATSGGKQVGEAVDFEKLPDYAKGAIHSSTMQRLTNSGTPLPDKAPYIGSVWTKETVPIGSLDLKFDQFTHRGSRTKGPIVVRANGEVIDGNNRLYEAVQRGDKTIEVYKEAPSPLPEAGATSGGSESVYHGGAGVDALNAKERAKSVGLFEAKQGASYPDFIIPEVKGGAVGGLPKYAEGSAINLERLNTTADVKQFINARTTEAEAKIGKRQVTWDETRAQAEALGWDVKAIEKEWKRKGAFTAAEIDATRQTNLNAITDLQKAIKDLPYNQTTLPPELRAKVLDAMGLIKVTSQAASESGRALNIHKRVLSNDPEFRATSELNRVLNVIAGKGGKRTDELINGLRDIDFNDPAMVNRFVYNATTTKWERLSSGGFQLWLEGLLSHPLTHIVNTTSNALTMAYSYPERLLGAGLETIRSRITGTPRGIYFGETVQDVFSISKGLQDAVNRFAYTLKKGDVATKFDYIPSALPDKISKYLPTRVLTAEDAFFKGFIENQELNRMAFREAKSAGLEGNAFKQKVTDLLTGPTEDMLNAAAERGKYLTYQKEVGEVGRLIFAARNKVPGLKYFIPFIKTPINIAKFALERTPFNLPVLAAKAIKGDLKGTALSEELAKPLMGTMLATIVYQLAERGYITGGTSKNASEREEKQNVGWQPYSVKIGDKYYSFARLEPLGSIMGMAADLSQIKKEMSENDKFNLASGIMGSITTNISNKTFMQGFTNMIQGISDPGRYGANVVKTLAGSIVPAVSGGVARSTDNLIRDTKTPLDTIQSRIPGLSKNLQSKLTVWGEPIERQGSPVGRFLSPMQISKEKGSPLEKEMVKLDLDIGYPSRKIGNVELSPGEYWDMVKQGGEPAKKMLDRVVTSPLWDQLSDYKKETFIESIINKYRESARKMIIIKLLQDGRLKPKDEKELMTIKNQLQ